MDRYVEVLFHGMAFGGDALGRLKDGSAIFVPFALPGERARVQVLEERKGYARGRLVELLEPSPKRIQPRCPHFTDCGGCQYQHISYPDQLLIKEQILKDQFQRIAGISDPPLEKIRPSSLEWNYRNAVQFHLDPEGKLGYHAASSHRVVPIRECHLPEKAIDETWPLISMEPLAGLDEIQLRQGADGQVMMILVSKTGELPELEIELPISVAQLSPAGMLALAGDDHLIMEVNGIAFQLSPGSFFQVNTLQAGGMVDDLLEHLPLSRKAVLLDVYCGVGLFSRFLAQKVKRLIAVELSSPACDDFTGNLDPFDNVELYMGAAGNILPILDVRADVMVLDPPRAGLEKHAMEAILKKLPPVIAYVSCDPATLARDAKQLIAAGYRLLRVQPFDLFPHTSHIESINYFHLA
jgi:23S rRNA (uracil1939-C5)-methyltransferase